MPRKPAKKKKVATLGPPLSVHVFANDCRIRIPGTAYGGPEQDVSAALLILRASGAWLPCPFGWYFVRCPETGDLIVDLAWNVLQGCVLLYPVPPKKSRKQRKASKVSNAKSKHTKRRHPV